VHCVKDTTLIGRFGELNHLFIAIVCRYRELGKHNKAAAGIRCLVDETHVGCEVVFQVIDQGVHLDSADLKALH
jgi:hypothetical protein